MPHTPQPQKPVLSPATFPIAVMRLARATDAELAEWDRALPREMRRYRAERAKRKRAA